MTDSEHDICEIAWKSMTRTPTILDTITGDGLPMPPDIALDMVQEVTGDRVQAARLMLKKASAKLSLDIPNGLADSQLYRLALIASLSAFQLESFNTRDALALLDRITHDTAHPDPREAGLVALDNLRQWAERSRAVILLSAELIEASKGQ